MKTTRNPETGILCLPEGETVLSFRNWILGHYTSAQTHYALYETKEALNALAELRHVCERPEDFQKVRLDNGYYSPSYLGRSEADDVGPLQFKSEDITLDTVDRFIKVVLERRRELESWGRIPSAPVPVEAARSQHTPPSGEAKVCAHCKGSGSCTCDACREKMPVISGQRTVSHYPRDEVTDTRTCFCRLCAGRGYNWIGPDKVDQSRHIEIKDQLPSAERKVVEELALKRLEAEERLLDKQIAQQKELIAARKLLLKVDEEGRNQAITQLERQFSVEVDHQSKMHHLRAKAISAESALRCNGIDQEQDRRVGAHTRLRDLETSRHSEAMEEAQKLTATEVSPREQLVEKEIQRIEKSIELERMKQETKGAGRGWWRKG